MTKPFRITSVEEDKKQTQTVCLVRSMAGMKVVLYIGLTIRKMKENKSK